MYILFTADQTLTERPNNTLVLSEITNDLFEMTDIVERSIN